MRATRPASFVTCFYSIPIIPSHVSTNRGHALAGNILPPQSECMSALRDLAINRKLPIEVVTVSA
jgi:hypothetical protein